MHGMRSAGAKPKASCTAASVLARLPCSTITAFGRPVVPEV